MTTVAKGGATSSIAVAAPRPIAKKVEDKHFATRVAIALSMQAIGASCAIPSDDVTFAEPIVRGACKGVCRVDR